MIQLRRPGGVLRIGHRGAASLAPENTLASIDAALEVGVDLVELDVRLRLDGALVLAHDSHTLGEAVTLDAGLERLAGSDAGVLLDLKCRGCEESVVAALGAHGLLRRAVVSSFWRRSLIQLRELEPSLARALSYPEDKLRLAERRSLAPLVRGGTAALRRLLPHRIGRWLDQTGAGAASLHVDVVSRGALERCHALGAAVFAWTVNDPRIALRLSKVGIDGIISDDPRIFSGWEA